MADEGWYVEDRKAKGLPPPDWALEPPPVGFGDDFWIRAFEETSTDRRVSGGPIPWSSIERWADAHDLDRITRRLLHRFVRAMDGELRAFERSKSERAEQSARGQSKVEEMRRRVRDGR